VKLILRKPAENAWEDFQLKDEHGVLVVSRNTMGIDEELLKPRNTVLLKFHFSEGTTAVKMKILVNSENFKFALIYKYMLMINISSQCYHSPIR